MRLNEMAIFKGMHSRSLGSLPCGCRMVEQITPDDNSLTGISSSFKTAPCETCSDFYSLLSPTERERETTALLWHPLFRLERA